MLIFQEDLEEAKQNWELARLKSLKEEEELRAEIEEDEMLYTYSKEDSNQVKKKKRGRSKKTVDTSDDEYASNDNEFRKSRKQRINSRKKETPSSSPKPQRSRLKSGDGILSGEESSGSRRSSRLASPNSRLSSPPNSPTKDGLRLKEVNCGEVASKSDKKATKKRSTSTGRMAKSVGPNSTQRHILNVPTVSPATKTASVTKVKMTKSEGSVVKTPKSVTKLTSKANKANIQVGTKSTPAQLKKTLKAQEKLAQSKKNKPITPIQKGLAKKILSPPVKHVEQEALTVQSPKPVINPATPQSTMKQTTPLSPKESNIPPPWSNPNLVIRTRRASQNEAFRVVGSPPNHMPNSPAPVRNIIQQNSPTVIPLQTVRGQMVQSVHSLPLTLRASPGQSIPIRAVQLPRQTQPNTIVRPQFSHPVQTISMTALRSHILQQQRQQNAVALAGGSAVIRGQIVQPTASITVPLSVGRQLIQTSQSMPVTTLKVGQPNQSTAPLSIVTLPTPTGLMQPVMYNIVKSNSVHVPLVNNQTVALGQQVIQANINQVVPNLPQNIVMLASKKTPLAVQQDGVAQNGHSVSDIKDAG